MDVDARKVEIFSSALQFIGTALNSSNGISASTQLYGPNGQRIIPTSEYSYRRDAAQRKGSLKNWIPQRLFDRNLEAYDRAQIVSRSVSLADNDPHAAGIVDSYAATVIGHGLSPIQSIDGYALGITDKEAIRKLQSQQKTVYEKWYSHSDAGRRMNFGAIQYLLERNLMEYGEYLVLLHMIDDPVRPYSLACHVINPQRLSTPTDKYGDETIKDGVEFGEYGEPVAYWIKKDNTPNGSSDKYARIPARIAHRPNVLHYFIPQEPEQMRGWPFFGPAMKYLRDLNDYLDAELVSNIVTAAFSLFIKTSAGKDPYGLALGMAGIPGPSSDPARNGEPRLQEFLPGQVLYGNEGEEAVPISANRPGTSFEPFTKTIKKAIAMSLNIPYPVLFKDVEGVNFAGFRSAMLDAWRVYMMHRKWMAENFCQVVYTMLQEEAYLKGELEAKDFYTNMQALTRCDWRGSPKGDIEPIKAAQADALLIQNNLKTRAESIAERGGDLRTTMDQLAEEQEMMRERGLTEEKISNEKAQKWADKENETGDTTVDDQGGAADEGL